MVGSKLRGEVGKLGIDKGGEVSVTTSKREAQRHSDRSTSTLRDELREQAQPLNLGQKL